VSYRKSRANLLRATNHVIIDNSSRIWRGIDPFRQTATKHCKDDADMPRTRYKVSHPHKKLPNRGQP
jgi:hypothetical protein